MPTTFTDPTDISLTAYYEGAVLRIDCEGSPLPVADQSIVCEVGAGVEVPFELEFDHTDSNRTASASHYDSAGMLLTWSGSNPCSHDFGLTGGFVDVTVVASTSSESRTTIVKIEIKPKTEKPYRG